MIKQKNEFRIVRYIIAKESFLTKGKASFLTDCTNEAWSEQQRDSRLFKTKKEADKKVNEMPKIYGCVVLRVFLMPKK
jgi:hypothetical protein